jgi:hypothetical protein
MSRLPATGTSQNLNKLCCTEGFAIKKEGDFAQKGKLAIMYGRIIAQSLNNLFQTEGCAINEVVYFVKAS